MVSALERTFRKLVCNNEKAVPVADATAALMPILALDSRIKEDTKTRIINGAPLSS